MACWQNDVCSEKAGMSRADPKGTEWNVAKYGWEGREKRRERKRSEEEWETVGGGNIGRLEYLSARRSQRKRERERERHGKRREGITIERRTDEETEKEGRGVEVSEVTLAGGGGGKDHGGDTFARLSSNSIRDE